MEYEQYASSHSPDGERILLTITRLGNSGLKVSKVILGCMSYGSPKWQSWILGLSTLFLHRVDVDADSLRDEKESLPVMKKAYDLGINTFDTADVYSK